MKERVNSNEDKGLSINESKLLSRTEEKESRSEGE